MWYLYAKAIHIIFVVTWFAGLFYIVRLFIYFTEAQERPESERKILQEQLGKMERLLWYVITVPSAWLTLIAGTVMLSFYWPDVPGWLWVKVGFVAGLYAYHEGCRRIFRQHQAGIVRYTGTQLRVWNEVATLFLVAIVFLVVVKNLLSVVWGLTGLFALMVVLLLAIRLYKRSRETKS